VRNVLGVTPTADTVLISEGYAPYQRYTKQTGLTHVQCGAHSRRGFFEAQAGSGE
jgi:transposase